MSTSNSSHTGPPSTIPARRAGSTPQRLDRYTATVISDLKVQTDTRITDLEFRVQQLQEAVSGLATVCSQAHDLIKDMGHVLKDLTQQQKGVVAVLESVSGAVGSMAEHQRNLAAHTSRHAQTHPGPSAGQLDHLKSTVDNELSKISSHTTDTDLSLDSLDLDSGTGAGPSNHAQSVINGNSKGKGKKGRKR